MSKNTPQTTPAATAAAEPGAVTPASLESLEIIAIDALQGIEAMAEIAARECDRGRGRVNARLVVRMLSEISFRANEAINALQPAELAPPLAQATLRAANRAAALEAAFDADGAPDA
jgi:hypothetical protein